jgi:uncharacterized protein YidB (DUF937 family)
MDIPLAAVLHAVVAQAVRQSVVELLLQRCRVAGEGTVAEGWIKI